MENINISEVEKECLALYEKNKDKSTVSDSEVPYVSIGYESIYEVSIRYASLSFKKPSWWFNIYCGGGVSMDGYKTISDAIDAAKDEVLKRQREFEEELNRNNQ